MAERPTFDEIYLRLAATLAQRSKCLRLQVGCVIASADGRHVFGVGYNGGAAGVEEDECTGAEGVCGCLHAEDNAVVNCGAPRIEQKVVLVTHLPCAACAKRIINLGGVVRVRWLESYRSVAGGALLARAGIDAGALR